eukprot:CAMPEP_0206265840 /NCGR_PEP_ID=MMETSP0047_2-20121206/30235_1 /ASSEMBLY_ACC=CAM_ASM_000192 /TAXON_ID=195065 /ORGANISM="Chroomonas mesostigmatica_cf, Strain CCMP1168" /LENGTH=157 /DNA_ID=CAMNT_0053693813 /DNA_START=36 /DNA_END=506 /DNA_ORIENTATION=-
MSNKDRVEAVWGVFVERVESAITMGRHWDAPVTIAVETSAALALRAVRVPSIAHDVPRLLVLLSSMPENSLGEFAGPLSWHVHDLLSNEGEALAEVGGVANAVTVLEHVGRRWPAAARAAVEGVGLVGLASKTLSESEWKLCLATLSSLAASEAAME